MALWDSPLSQQGVLSDAVCFRRLDLLDTPSPGKLAGFRSIRAAGGALLVALAVSPVPHRLHVQAATILSANLSTDAGGFTYVDDPFLGTSQPAYASGVRQATGGYGGTGGLR